MPLAAQDGEAFIWHYSAVFPIDPAAAELNLVATQPGDLSDGALPGGLIWARCAPGNAAGNVVLRMEAYPSSGIAFDAYDVRMSDVPVGNELIVASTIVNRAPGQPTGGREMIVDADGPEMALLANSALFYYGITGFEDFYYPFDLTGNQDYVGRFISDCATVSGGALVIPTLPLPGQAAGALVPDLGPEISGHVWSRFSQVSDNVFETQLRVIYGVPETDDVAIMGQCFIGAQGPLVALQIAADITGLAENDLATLRIRNGAGQQIDVDGSVIGTAIEFGVSGIELVLEMSDPAWLVIAGDPTVHFERVGGAGGFTLTGNGPSTLGPFLTDCDQIDRLTPESGLSPSAPIGAQEGYLACDSFGRVGSRETGQPTVVTFRNETGLFRALLWIDPNGVPVDQGGLNPGEALSFTTDPGHIWMATDGPGNCQEMIQPVVGQTIYSLTVQ
ncbi:hypothetical protein KUL25_07010 [Rhodobacteraceae bacterium N5(2021)]|uniref:Uncharacterized protein n=1 Tax=Gymnodinialimonas phycosphaerae TaxID=2841589 RepID=A0A975YH87_9RHOB|nr:hypothetical protein [Gymnodinialimonas phycosphaerae]MBY4892510.1 hypothetical protein [Gymnodinialimonas phycosphaerae]